MTGLSTTQAVALLAQVGPNALPERAPDPGWRRFVRQFQSPLIYILLFALVFDAGLWIYEGTHGWPIEALAIGVILLLNAALSLYQERRSEAALARLKALVAAQTWVLRDGQLVHLPSTDLVPGDWVRLETGDRVPADGALVDTHGIMLDEAILTGESVPVDKAGGDEAFSGTDGRPVSYLKGAPEVLIARSALPAAERESWIGKADAYAREGYSRWPGVKATRKSSCRSLGSSCCGTRPAPKCPTLCGKLRRRVFASS